MRTGALASLLLIASLGGPAWAEDTRSMSVEERELRQTNPDASDEEIAAQLAEWQAAIEVQAAAEREAAKNAPPPPTVIPIDRLLWSMPKPANMTAVREYSPEFFRATERFLPASNRLVEMYLTAEDAMATRRGEAAAMRRQFQFQLPRALEGREVSLDEFEDAGATLEKELARAAVPGMEFLGVHRREPWATFFTMSIAGPADTAGGETYGAGAVMRLGGQLVYLYSYADKTLPDARQLAQSSLDDWANAAHAADPITRIEIEAEEAAARRRPIIGSLLAMVIVAGGAFAIRRIRNA